MLSGLLLVAFLFNTIQNTNITNTKAQYDDGYDSSFNSSFEVAQENYQDDYGYPYQATAFNDTFDTSSTESGYFEPQYQEQFDNQNYTQGYQSQTYAQNTDCDYEYGCEDQNFMMASGNLDYAENDKTNLAANTTDYCYDENGYETSGCVSYEASNPDYSDQLASNPNQNYTECFNSSEITKIVITKSERKLRTYNCEGKYLNAYNAGVGTGNTNDGWGEPTPVVTAVIPKSDVLSCGGSCDGRTHPSHPDCGPFEGNGVRNYVITFATSSDGKGCYSIHGYPNTGESHGCVRVLSADIKKIYDNLSSVFTVEVTE